MNIHSGLMDVINISLILITENSHAEVEHSGFAVRMVVLLICSSRLENFVYGDFLIRNVLTERVKGMYVTKNMIMTG